MDGPATWEEVDTSELKRIALQICSSSVPSTDHTEAASRLAMQAANLDADTLDPLALGRVDTRQLQLVSFLDLLARQLPEHEANTHLLLPCSSSRSLPSCWRMKQGSVGCQLWSTLQEDVLPTSH